MKTISLKRLAWGWCALALLGAAAVRAQEPEDVPAVEPAAAESNAPPAAEPPAETVAPSPPAKPSPIYRGADMQDAFKGAGSSRFGMSGRVNKLPAKKSLKREKDAWKRDVELGIDTARGNRDILRVDGSVRAAKETEENYYFLKAAGRYGESDDEKDAENATGEAKLQHKLTERTYAALDGNLFHDRLADLSYRARGSLSLGRHFIASDRTVLSAELGPGYVAERKGGEEEGFLAGRAAQYLEFLVTDSLQVWQTVEFVQNLEDSAVFFVNAELGLETVLVSSLSLRFTVEDRYDSNPADGKEANDLLTATALSWSF